MLKVSKTWQLIGHIGYSMKSTIDTNHEYLHEIIRTKYKELGK
jgi:hypothetical protein